MSDDAHLLRRQNSVPLNALCPYHQRTQPPVGVSKLDPATEILYQSPKYGKLPQIRHRSDFGTPSVLLTSEPRETRTITDDNSSTMSFLTFKPHRHRSGNVTCCEMVYPDPHDGVSTLDHGASLDLIKHAEFYPSSDTFQSLDDSKCSQSDRVCRSNDRDDFFIGTVETIESEVDLPPEVVSPPDMTVHWPITT